MCMAWVLGMSQPLFSCFACPQQTPTSVFTSGFFPLEGGIEKNNRGFSKKKKTTWVIGCRDKGGERKRSKWDNHRLVERRLLEEGEKMTHVSVFVWEGARTCTRTLAARRIECLWEWKHQDISVLLSWNTLRITHQIRTVTFEGKTGFLFFYTLSYTTVTCTRMIIFPTWLFTQEDSVSH